jgi:polysaccharide export outer membrane protein
VGDFLRIEVWRQPEYSGSFEIGSERGLLHPLYQEIPIAGLPLATARDRIADFLSGYLQGARIVVQPLYSVSVAGEVGAPNVYHVTPGTSVAQAIALAGGLTTRARLDRVLMIREGEQFRLDLGQGIASFGTIPVVSGDQVFVPETSQFSIWRDVVAPVGSLATLVLTVVRLTDR